jgi:hypothetical protein
MTKFKLGDRVIITKNIYKDEKGVVVGYTLHSVKRYLVQIDGTPYLSDSTGHEFTPSEMMRSESLQDD